VVILLVLFFPIVLYGFFEWRVYFPTNTLLHVAIVAVPLSSLGFVICLRRRKRLLEMGRVLPRLGLVQLAGVLCTLFVVFYLWSLVVISLFLLLPHVERSDRVFQIAVAKECTWKCAACKYEVGLKDWPGFSRSRLCADNMGPRVLVLNRVIVRGYFTDNAIYVSGVYTN
jgi:hypothetical protein